MGVGGEVESHSGKTELLERVIVQNYGYNGASVTTACSQLPMPSFIPPSALTYHGCKDCLPHEVGIYLQMSLLSSFLF